MFLPELNKKHLFLRQFHRLIELIFKRNFSIPCQMYFHRFQELSHLSSKVRNNKMQYTFFCSSDNIFCGKCCRKISNSAKIGECGGWVGLEHFSGPRIVKSIDRQDCFEFLGSHPKFELSNTSW